MVDFDQFKKELITKKKQEITIRSSTAEYLTYISAVGNTNNSVEIRYEDENIWLTQKMMAELYGVSVSTINEHIKNVFDDNELTEDSVIRKFRITASDGKSYGTKHYNLQMIIAVGFKVNNERAIQFREWANAIVKDYTIQGWVMDEERLKNGGTILTEDYFQKQLEKIREIRLSERLFYQKITEIYATSIDYDANSKTTQRFFAAVQNKLHYSIHGQTAAELVCNRADAEKENMGPTSWEGAPNSKIHKYNVVVAKKYLTEKEIAQLGRLVSTYLDLTEDQAERQIPMTMQDWEERLNGFLKMWDREVLQDNGKISAELAKTKAESVFLQPFI